MATGSSALFQLLPDRASETLLDPFNAHRLWLTLVFDAVIIFLLRVIMIQLFQHKLPPEQIKVVTTQGSRSLDQSTIIYRFSFN